ncbi:hypothetical protein HDU67_005102 [Dinochytrium kinnereticum]|nr:hypothetical protein HDU67_005102 [Dinochytrium kinnereticum]
MVHRPKRGSRRTTKQALAVHSDGPVKTQAKQEMTSRPSASRPRPSNITNLPKAACSQVLRPTPINLARRSAASKGAASPNPGGPVSDCVKCCGSSFTMAEFTVHNQQAHFGAPATAAMGLSALAATAVNAAQFSNHHGSAPTRIVSKLPPPQPSVIKTTVTTPGSNSSASQDTPCSQHWAVTSTQSPRTNVTPVRFTNRRRSLPGSSYAVYFPDGDDDSSPLTPVNHRFKHVTSRHQRRAASQTNLPVGTKASSKHFKLALAAEKLKNLGKLSSNPSAFKDFGSRPLTPPMTGPMSRGPTPSEINFSPSADLFPVEEEESAKKTSFSRTIGEHIISPSPSPTNMADWDPNVVQPFFLNPLDMSEDQWSLGAATGIADESRASNALWDVLTPDTTNDNGSPFGSYDGHFTLSSPVTVCGDNEEANLSLVSLVTVLSNSSDAAPGIENLTQDYCNPIDVAPWTSGVVDVVASPVDGSASPVTAIETADTVDEDLLNLVDYDGQDGRDPDDTFYVETKDEPEDYSLYTSALGLGLGKHQKAFSVFSENLVNVEELTAAAVAVEPLNGHVIPMTPTKVEPAVTVNSENPKRRGRKSRLIGESFAAVESEPTLPRVPDVASSFRMTIVTPTKRKVDDENHYEQLAHEVADESPSLDVKENVDPSSEVRGGRIRKKIECEEPGCLKVYASPAGLRYHLLHHHRNRKVKRTTALKGKSRRKSRREDDDDDNDDEDDEDF